MSDLTKLIAPSFYGVHHDIKAGRHTHYWLKGGRGSTKSSFISVETILGMMQDTAANALVLRKVAANLKDSVYEQLLWAIEALGVEHLWKAKLSPLQLSYLPTGQRILFRGAAAISASSRTGSIVPISLFASIIDTRRGEYIVFSSVSGRIVPSFSGAR